MSTIRQARAGEWLLDGSKEGVTAKGGEEIVAVGSMLFTSEEAMRCGVHPEKAAVRFRSQLATLERLGHGRTREATALRRATR